MQLNNINCEFTDSESDTENTISIKLINVENDYEPMIYEQPIYFHDQFLSKMYKISVKQHKKKEKIEKVEEDIKEEKPTECSSTTNIYQNIPQETHLRKVKIWTITLLLESPKSKQLQTPDLEIDFLNRFWSRIKYYKQSHLE